MEQVKELLELMNEYLALEEVKFVLRKKCMEKEGSCEWNDLYAQLGRNGCLKDYKKAEDSQNKLLGITGPYYSDFGDDETRDVFIWLKNLLGVE